MNLPNYLLEHNNAELGRAIGVSPVVISQWKRGYRPVPIEYMAKIEAATDRRVTRQEMRPDDYRDIWPELYKKKVSK